MNLATIRRPDYSNLPNSAMPVRVSRHGIVSISSETFVPRQRYVDMTQPDIWYVAFGPDKSVKTDDSAESGPVRSTRTFKTEVDAKLFAMQILAKGWTASAGTLNPHQPKQVVGPGDVERWADPRLAG